MAQEPGRKRKQPFVENDFSHRETWRARWIGALLSLVFMLFPLSAFAAITAFVESPVEGVVSGVQIVRGWAFDTTPGVSIEQVNLFIDEREPFEIPCCGQRADVAAFFPQYPISATLQSGWGLTFNWGVIPPGTHAVRVEIRNTQGEIWVSPPRQVEVISFGGFEFVEELSIAQATVRLERAEIILTGVQIRDKATGAERELPLRLRWDGNAQTLVCSGVTLSQETASLQGVLRRLATPLRAWLARAVNAGSVQAGEGIQAEWESPVDGQVVAGIGVVRAWAFAEEPGTPITDVRLLLDGQLLTTLPCCSARDDVKAAFPENPNAEQSGVGAVVNYGDLTAGPHTLELVITAANGARRSFLRNVVAIQPGGFAFLDLFDLSNATVRIEGEDLVLENVVVREKASQIQRTVTLRFRWDTQAQGFVLVSNTPPVALDQTMQVRKGQSVALTLLATDADGDPLVYEIVSEPGQGQLSGTPPQLTYTPSLGFTGQDQFTFQARDFTSTSNTATVTLTLNALNLPPTFKVGADQTVLEDAGPQTVPGWATGIDDGDPGVAQTLTFQVIGNTNPGLFAAGPAVDAAGTLTYTPAPNANGNATITLVLRDNGGTAGGGQDTSIPRTFIITVTPVNDAPSFTVGPDQTVLEDAGPQTVAGWAPGISDGDGGGQTLTFSITDNTNPGLFAAGPAVDAAGTLTYTPTPNANGNATITLVLQDDGGTANGGQDTSAPQTFTITVTPVNDAPNFTAGPDQTVLEDAGPQTVAGWATGIDDGDPEVAQTLTFQVTDNTNPDLFAPGGEPAVDAATGTLTYTPAAETSGAARITLVLQDDGGTANGGQDTSAPQTFTITVTPVNDIPTFTANDPPVVNGNSGRSETVAGWATFSPGPPDESSQTPTYLVNNIMNAALFSVLPSVAANGTLTYTPDMSGVATFDVRVQDSGGTSNGGVDTSAAQTFTVTVTSGPLIAQR